MVRGREEAGPNPQDLLRETSVDDGNSDDDSVSSYTDRWVPGSGMPGSFCLVVGPFGPLAPVVSVEGGPRAAAVFATVFLLILESPGPLILGAAPIILRVFVWRRAPTSTYGWGVWQVAPAFPSCGRPLALSESSFSAPYSSGRGDLSGEFPLSGEVFPSDTACYA
jgi:hypothetical protein